jgi:teichoic acid transport system permease protein
MNSVKKNVAIGANMVFQAIRYIVDEHLSNIKRIGLLSIAHAKMQTEGTSLGIWWTFIRDAANFITLVFFRLLLAGNAQVEGMHLMVYLATGLIPWLFINEILNNGVNALIANKTLVMSIQFPVVILPTIETCATFIKRLFNIVVLFVIVIIFGNISKFNIWLFLYYYFATFTIMVVYNLLVSSIISLSKDFKNFYLTFLRAIFFLTPIMWSFDRVENNPVLITLLKLNPFSYPIMGFRDAFEHGLPPHWNHSVYFWSVVTILFILGSIFQYKLRKYYADYM